METNVPGCLVSKDARKPALTLVLHRHSTQEMWSDAHMQIDKSIKQRRNQRISMAKLILRRACS